jgi:phosphoribosylamine--glycine ligase
MKVLLVGGGGREHALAWRLRTDDPTLDLVAAPGNPGIAELARCVAIAADDVAGLLALARRERPDYTIVGPEAPLSLGIVDEFRAAGLAIFGPTRAAAEIETSKTFAKALMLDAGVPTAAASRHTEVATARRAAHALGAPIVVKASGLAAGKGVIVCETHADADRAIDFMLRDEGFGAAGAEILVEEFMEGEEVSAFFITDGVRAVPLLPAQDHKRLLDGDRGPNTGGMGAYAPVSLGTAALGEVVLDRIIEPTLAALRDRGRPFTGLLYAGLMLTHAGPKVVEFNCRFGDPETQAILPLCGPIGALCHAVARGDALDSSGIVAMSGGSAVTTVLAAAGYPDSPRRGDQIVLPPIEDEGVHVFHAGTARDATGGLVTAGGRVLAVTAVAPTFAEAQARSARYAALIDFAGKQYRTDIGWRELARRRRAGTS